MEKKVDTVPSGHPFEGYGEEQNIPRSEQKIMQPKLQVVISRIYMYSTVVTQTSSVVQVTTNATIVENLP